MQHEAREQQKLVAWCDNLRLPLFAIPNGGKRDAKEAYFLMMQGVKKGVPDLFLPISRRGFHGLFIELKYGKNKTTPHQDRWIALLNHNGYLAKVCYGADNAIRLIDWYLNG